jgi:3',5'-cyclic-AMP phosphodiesterase
VVTPASATPELSTVADDEAVAHHGTDVQRWDDLEPDTPYELGGFEFRTLSRPGERLATVATVNDVHFGEEVAGIMEGLEDGPLFRAAPGDDPYPEVMNRAAIAEISELDPDVVVVKGDLTCDGTDEEYAAFLDAYQPPFGDRLHHVRGNHDAYRFQDYAPSGPQRIDVEGLTIALLDTTLPGKSTGGLDAEQLEWLDDLASDVDRPILTLGHHHVWNPGATARPDDYFGIHPDDSERFIELVARRPAIIGYAAGHTHRNRVRRFAATGDVPFIEVACVKDYPGSWAEYRVFDGGVLQVHRRISHPKALEWTEKTRHMFAGMYADYALGALDDRCFLISPRP